ncbi:MAG: helix-turn-helix transcriptional regulator [Peptostreptococcaceae bacterium]|nr:helix-turn-helix transcriptional regulator [Peptostreptococcaceae bacterium]
MNERVRELRKALNLTMEKFGERVGVQKTAISRIESGVNNLTDQMLKLICREFSVNEDWLRSGQGDMFIISKEDYISEVSKSYNLDTLDEAIIRAYMSLDSKKRAVLKEYISNVAKGYEEDEEAKRKAQIDEEVEAYRRELEAEAKGAVKSSVLQEQKESTGGNIKKAN